jgi:hypothetical protein
VKHKSVNVAPNRKRGEQKKINFNDLLHELLYLNPCFS